MTDDKRPAPGAGKAKLPKAPASHREISTPVTALCVALAACAAVFAGFATFKTENELGTAGAFLVGLFFAVVALSGRVPRIKFGDNEIDPGTAYAAGTQYGADAVADAADEAAITAKSPKEVATASRVSQALVTAAAAESVGDSYVKSEKFRALTARERKAALNTYAVLFSALQRLAKENPEFWEEYQLQQAARRAQERATGDSSEDDGDFPDRTEGGR